MFHGVRGSTACNDDATRRYGGNTSCVAMFAPREAPLIFDLGTGVRYVDVDECDGSTLVNCLVSHLHWDHIQGLPFFAPLQDPRVDLNIWAPTPNDGCSAGAALRGAISPPTFPVALEDIGARVRIVDVSNDDFEVGSYAVRARVVPHIGPTVGYRVTLNGRSVVYISDHQESRDGMGYPSGVQELCDGADVLIHDAQYLDGDFAGHEDWGHCRVNYAFELAVHSGVRTLVLFHHDPSRSDDALDEIAAEYGARGSEVGLEVIVAREGLELSYPLECS